MCKRGSFLLFVLLLPVFAMGRDIYVAPGGTNNYPYTNWPDAATNIEWAVSVAADAETVFVSNGVYVLTNTIVITNGVCLRSWNDGLLADPVGTVVDGNAKTRCFRVAHSNALLEGFTMTNGYYVNSDGGGGVSIQGGQVRNCRITHCVRGASSGNRGGGGVFMVNGILSNCVVSNCLSMTNGGGGIYVYTSGTDNQIIRCEVVNNSATNNPDDEGGGIYCGGNNLKVMDCIIRGNTASKQGGGIYIIGSSAYTQAIAGCAITENLATNMANQTSYGSGGGLHMAGNNRNCMVSNCVIANNTAFTKQSGGSVSGGGGVVATSRII